MPTHCFRHSVASIQPGHEKRVMTIHWPGRSTRSHVSAMRDMTETNSLSVRVYHVLGVSRVLPVK